MVLYMQYRWRNTMTYEQLVELLLSKNIYNELKQEENKIFKLIPELKQCKGFNQNNKWHIYDVYEHILHVIVKTKENKCLRIAALFHDIGKPLTYTEDENGIGHFYNHWNKSVEVFEKYKDKLSLSKEEKLLISNLIFYHDINIEKLSTEEKNKMLEDIGQNNINLLFSLKKADLLAQNPEYHYLLENITKQEENINL